MATPMVAGIAALVKSQNPTYDSVDLKAAILDSGDAVSALETKVSSGSRANANNAVRYIQPPSGVTASR